MGRERAKGNEQQQPQEDAVLGGRRRERREKGGRREGEREKGERSRLIKEAELAVVDVALYDAVIGLPAGDCGCPWPAAMQVFSRRCDWLSVVIGALLAALTPC